MILISVDFPAPFSPTKDWISPATEVDGHARAGPCVDPKRLETSVIDSNAWLSGDRVASPSPLVHTSPCGLNRFIR